MKVEVDVCVPTYNQASFLSKALDSILEQKGCKFHIIVANDGSTDETESILERYNSAYPGVLTIINQTQNRGLVKNTQDCIMASSSEYIAILEGDDYWCDQEKLKKQINILNSDEKIAMVHTGWMNYYESKGLYEDVSYPEKKVYYPEFTKGVNSVEVIMKNEYRPIRLSSCVFRKEIIVRALQDGILKFSSAYTTLDLPLFYSSAYYGEIKFLNHVTTVYRVLEESVSITNSKNKSALYCLGCYHIYLDFFRNLSINKSTRDKIIREMFMTLYPYALINQNRDLAQFLRKSSVENGYKLRVGQKLCHFGTLNAFTKKLVQICLSLNKILIETRMK